VDNKKVPDLSNSKRADIPEKLRWNVSDIYENKSKWNEDKELAISLISEIENKKKNWNKSAKTILELLNHLTRIDQILTKTYGYSSLNSDTDMEISTFISDKGEIHSLFIDFSGKTSFLESEIIKLGEKKIADFIKNEPKLSIYQRFFDSIFRIKDHILNEEKSWIISQTGLFADSAERASSMLDNVDMPSEEILLKNKEKIILNSANYVKHRQSAVKADRRKVMKTYWINHTKYKNTFAVLLDSAMKQHLFNARVHNYKDTLTAALYPKKIDNCVYSNLIDTVKSNLSPLHRYLKLKKKLLKLDKLEYGDIYASAIPSINLSYSIDEAKELIINALAPLGDEYVNILQKALNNRWMDVYANKGKRSGAYSQGSIYDTHPFVLMNYNGTLDSVSTLAHEFGHSLHSYFSNNNQPIQLADYPIFLAEIASTFNEVLLTNYMVEKTDNRNLKLYILDQYIDGIRGTLFRQTLFAEFELEIHRLVESGQTLTSDLLEEKYMELTKLYYGHDAGIVEVNDYIKNEWSGIPHFYYNYYVYQYSTGISASIALAEKVLSGGVSEQKQYLNFLKAGNSDYPLNTLKKTGVDLKTSAPIIAAINNFERAVIKMEKLIQ